MYCEKCGKKINPGEICSCQKNASRGSQNDAWNSQRKKGRAGNGFRGSQNDPVKKSKKRPTKKRGEGNIYVIISFLLLIFGAEAFGYFWMGTDNFLEQIPVEFVVQYKKYVSYVIIFVIFLCGTICGIVACKNGSVKKLALGTFLLNLFSCIVVCAITGIDVYKNYEVIKLCESEWTEASAQKITKAYSEAEWDDPLRTNIENAVLKKIDSLQEEYTQKTTEYESVISQLEAISSSGVSDVTAKAEDAKSYVEEAENQQTEKPAEPETEKPTEPETEEPTEPETEKPTEPETEKPTEPETEEPTEPETEKPTEPQTEKITEVPIDSDEAFIDAVLNEADELIAKGSTDDARKLLLQAYNTTKSLKIQEKLDELSTGNSTIQTEAPNNNAETEANKIPQSGIHRYDYCLLDGTWEDAYRECIKKGGHLVTFETQEEYNYVVQELNNRIQQEYIFFIGGRRDLDSRLYYWVDESNNLIGTALNSADAWNAGCWLHDEPSFEDTTLGLQEHVLSMFYYDDLGKWVWNDVPNDLVGALSYYSGKVGYICEYEN